MRLQTWMKLSGVTPTKLSRMTGVRRPLVYKWLDGRIGLQGIASIYAITGGVVTPLDLAPVYAELGQSAEAEAARAAVTAATKEITT